MNEAFGRRLTKDPALGRRRAVRTQSLDTAPPPPPADPIEVSRYISEICGGLTEMASSAKLGMLTYLLAMARQEAERIARTGSVAE